MRVVVGPVSAQSAREWLGYARSVVDELERIAPGECFATPEVQEIFDGYLLAWERAASGRGDFTWESDIAAEQVEYHVHAFHQVATMLARQAELTGEPQSPPEGEEFYTALLSGVFAALQTESAASAEFAQHLGQFWPGRERVIH